MSVLDEVKKMSMDEFYHLCNRVVREMGFRVRNGVYRENTVVIDAYMPLPGNELRYVIVFVRKERLTGLDMDELVDFETLQIRWMIITTGQVDDSARQRIPENMQITIMDGSEFERVLNEFGVLRKKQESGSYLPSVGEVDNLVSWANEFYGNGNYEKALEYINQALRIKATPAVLKTKARILVALGRYDEALGLLKDVLVSNVKDDDAWFMMGSALEQMGVSTEAEEAYGQCVRFNPRNVGCWLNRGNVLFSMEKYDEALLCYENALKVRQDIPNAWNNRGVVLKYKGNYDEAIRSYNAALKYDPTFAQAHLNKAILFYDMRRYEEAENSAYEYLKLQESESAYILLANIYLKRAMPGKAEEMAKKALELNPGSIEAKKLLRHIYGGKTREVETEVMHGIEDILSMLTEEDLAPIRDILARAREHAKRGELEEAREALDEARQAMQRYVDERAFKNALIEDIIEIARESGGEVPENIEDMDVDELRAYRTRQIRSIKVTESESKTREKLLDSLSRMERELEEKSMLTSAYRDAIDNSRKLVDEGKFSEAMETLLLMGAELEKGQIKDMRDALIADTVTLLKDANMDVPEDLESMELDRIKELRSQAIRTLKGETKEPGGGGSLKEMVNILSGAAGAGASAGVSAGAGAATGTLKDDIIEDIHELSAVAEMSEPENLDSMSLDELKQFRNKIIEALKSRPGHDVVTEDVPRGAAHVLFESGAHEQIPDVDDEYANNVRGILAFESKDYQTAIKRFRRALAIRPDFKEAEFNLAYALYLAGNEEEARIHLVNIGMDEHFFEKQKNLNP